MPKKERGGHHFFMQNPFCRKKFYKRYLFPTLFYILKVNSIFKNRHFLSEVDKTTVLFVLAKIRVFFCFSVDKVDNSVHKSIFPVFSRKKMWITRNFKIENHSSFVQKSIFLCIFSKSDFLNWQISCQNIYPIASTTSIFLVALTKKSPGAHPPGHTHMHIHMSHHITRPSISKFSAPPESGYNLHWYM